MVDTISLDDFLLLVSYAASTGKKQAFALQQAFMKSTAVDFFRYHFGCRDLTMQEKLKPFEEKYSHTIAWLEEENANRRADWQLIEEQENFTGLNQYRPLLDEN